MKSDMDSREWLDDYQSLKQVNPNNPFTVPDGYFDELHQRATSRAMLDGIMAAQTAFTVPENYFGEMQTSLQARINIAAALENTAGNFTVPENYFEDMQASLQTRINIEEALHTTTGDFTVPENYFEDLHQQINNRIVVEEILNGQPHGFTVPENYFDNLHSAITAKIAQPQVKETAKPVKRSKGAVVRKMWTSGAFKYATAACLVVAVGATILISNFESPQAVHNRSYIHKALSNVPDDDIIDYLQMHMDAADTRGVMDAADQINTGDVNADDLKDYLSTH